MDENIASGVDSPNRRSVLKSIGAMGIGTSALGISSGTAVADEVPEFGAYCYVADLDGGSWSSADAQAARQAASKYPIHTIYPMVPTSSFESSAYNPWLDFVRDMNDIGVDVVPVVGGGGGGVTAENTKTSASQVLKWDNNADEDASIRGLQLDVESGAYGGDYPALLSGISDFHDWMDSSWGSVEYSVAVSAAWESHDGWFSAVNHATLDYVTLMAYGGGSGGDVEDVTWAAEQMNNVYTPWELGLGLYAIDGDVNYATGTFAEEVGNNLDTCFFGCPGSLAIWHVNDMTL